MHINKEINIEQMPSSVLWWLSYNMSLDRDYILSESSIKYPLAEYLGKSNADWIKLEQPHPKFSKKRLDLCFKNNEKIKYAFEFKYINKGSTRSTREKCRIFNDLMRLYYLIDDGFKCYFLICGRKYSFIADFMKIANPDSKTKSIEPRIQNIKTVEEKISEGFYIEWFSFNLNDSSREINLENQSNIYKKIYKNFESDYLKSKINKKKLEFPRKIITNLIYISSVERKSLEPATVGVWEILKV